MLKEFFIKAGNAVSSFIHGDERERVIQKMMDIEDKVGFGPAEADPDYKRLSQRLTALERQRPYDTAPRR